MSALSELLPHLLWLGVLLCLSGFFSGSETALFSLSKAQVKRMSNGTAGERAATDFLHQPQRLLSTILVGNMLVNVMLASIVAKLAQSFAGRGVGIAIGTSTFLLLIFGELTPKTIALHYNRSFARFAAIPLRVLSIAIAPVRFVLRHVTNAALALMRQQRVPGWAMLTHEEVAAMLAAGEAAGVTDERERELAERLLNLSTIDARDAMVPRTDVVGVSDTLTVGEAFAMACRCRHSRLPVYAGDLDGIWGIMSVVDFPRWRGTAMMDRVLADLRLDAEGGAKGQASPSPVYAVHVVPETAGVEQLLGTMQELRSHFVVVVDEYGGTSGILTLEDILEEVVGQMSPSGTLGRTGYVKDGDDILADGRTHLRDLNQETGWSLPLEGTDTIGGYVMELLGRLPRAGDVIEDQHHRFRVIKMGGRRIGAVRIEKLASRSEEGDA